MGAAEGQAEAKAGGIHQPTDDIACPHRASKHGQILPAEEEERGHG